MKILTEYIKSIDEFRKDLGVNSRTADFCERKCEKLEMKSKNYAELAKLQGLALRRFCGICKMENPNNPFEIIPENEYFLWHRV